ncbi:MAG TPA: polysaccharide biosynthesis/export family protein [Candidatus Angelobacter sp.]|nr:polysaccharide biosynthesis/export family protein [Candidatus Angelobacter sp.]
MNQHITRSDLIFRQVQRWLWTGVAALALCGMAGAQELAKAEKPVGSKDAKVSSPEKAVEQPEYIVGEGDVLHINVWKENEISQTVVVRPDGNISLPLVNEIPVAGLSPRQIQQLVTEKLKSILTNPQVTVSVAEVRSKMVYITGEVGKPGAYSVASPLNVLQLIARAGGLNEFASRKNIYILRGNDKKNRLHFNYKEVVKGKHSEQNIILQPGDTVVVP